jgi:hypothetical protein
MQQEINLNLARLSELGVLRATLEHITPALTAATAVPGSVVYTNNGNFYIAIGAGKVTIDGTSFFCISAASPVGANLLGKEAGYSFELNGKRIVIERIA